MNLQLSLKTKWFEMTKSGVKKEDYREITPLWCNRFLVYNNETKPQKFWDEFLTSNRFDLFDIKSHWNFKYYFEAKVIQFKTFDYNIMTLGYPHKGQLHRILTLEHKGIHLRYGNPEWGAEKGKIYFVIKHGNIIEPRIFEVDL
jgi:hypothetical protein